MPDETSRDQRLRDLMHEASDLPPTSGLIQAAQARGRSIRRRRRIGAAVAGAGVVAAAIFAGSSALGDYAVTEPVLPATSPSPTLCPPTTGEPVNISTSARSAATSAVMATALAACAPAQTTAAPQPSETASTAVPRVTATAPQEPSQPSSATPTEMSSATARPSATASQQATSLPDGEYCGEITAADVDAEQVTFQRWVTYTPQKKKESGDVHRLDVSERPTGDIRSNEGPGSRSEPIDNMPLRDIMTSLAYRAPTTLTVTVSGGQVTQLYDHSVGLGGEFFKGCRLSTADG